MLANYQELITEKFLSLRESDIKEKLKLTEVYLSELGKAYHSPSGTTSSENNQLDPLPLIFQDDEIQFFKKGISQWGRFISHLYNELFCSNEILKSSLFVADNFWKNPAWTPSLQNIHKPDKPAVTIFRLDLTIQNGSWKTIRIETSILRGLGYSLLNRIVHSRYFNTFVEQVNLIRLAPFFQELKHFLIQNSPYVRDVPGIAFWTEGPTDADYFEQVYLARYFGFPLLESRDLTVRSGRVFLKNLGGLQPVDVLVRWIDDANLDPLHGSIGILKGVAGLIGAVRNEKIFLVNKPGSSIVSDFSLWKNPESALESLLGEESLLPLLTNNQSLGTLPFWKNDKWIHYPFILRLFAAQSKDEWNLMPGGLVQSCEGIDPRNVSNFDSTSKDVWFLSSTFVPKVSLLPAIEKPLEVIRISELPSRVADDLSWLGRYSERAWYYIRLIEKWQEGRQGGQAEQDIQAFVFLKKLFSELGLVPTEVIDIETAHLWSSLKLTVAEIQRVSSQVLDRLSLETHRVLRGISAIVQTMDHNTLEYTSSELSLRLAAFNGLTQENMTRSPGWRFLDIGKRVERAELLIETLYTFFSTENHLDNLSLLLDLFDSTITYRTRYRLSPQLIPVMDLLLLDESNPRSLAFQAVLLNNHIEQLPRTYARAYRSAEERSVLEFLTKLRLTETVPTEQRLLLEYLDSLRRLLQRISNSIYERYFAQITPTESLQARMSDEK